MNTIYCSGVNARNNRRHSVAKDLCSILSAEELEKKLNEYLEDGNSHEFITLLQVSKSNKLTSLLRYVNSSLCSN